MRIFKVLFLIAALMPVMAMAKAQQPGEYDIPEKPKWVTLYLPHGKKNKVNKIDIVGFLTKAAGLKSEDIGLIEVKDFFSFVAIRKTKANHTLHLAQEEKIKGKKAKMEIAK